MINGLIRRIEVPSVLEILSERFDNFHDLMVPGSVVFGGALRDVIAGLPIEGDLDIAVSADDYGDLFLNFQKAPKWTRLGEDGKPVPKRTFAPIDPDNPHNNNINMFKKGLIKANKYPKNMPISDVVTFATIGNIKVQLIKSDSTSTDARKAILHIVQNVDLRCCSVFMDSEGDCWEAVRGAEQDCIDRVLNILKEERIDLERTLQRINKLTRRGWTSNIDVNKLTSKVRKLEAIRKRKEGLAASKIYEAIKKIKGSKLNANDWYFKIPASISTTPGFPSPKDIDNHFKGFKLGKGLVDKEASFVPYGNMSTCPAFVFTNRKVGEAYMKSFYNFLVGEQSRFKAATKEAKEFPEEVLPEGVGIEIPKNAIDDVIAVGKSNFDSLIISDDDIVGNYYGQDLASSEAPADGIFAEELEVEVAVNSPQEIESPLPDEVISSAKSYAKYIEGMAAMKKAKMSYGSYKNLKKKYKSLG